MYRSMYICMVWAISRLKKKKRNAGKIHAREKYILYSNQLGKMYGKTYSHLVSYYLLGFGFSQHSEYLDGHLPRNLKVNRINQCKLHY